MGCVLATQNPVDLDYKGLSNAGTWFLGRLQTERDKMRVMEGLEGASAQAGSTFDKQAMERTLAGVGSRVFLMNNVHEDAPRVFHTRWAMSYLSGPLSRGKIEELMDPVRGRFLPPPDEADDADLRTDEPPKPEESPPEPEPKSSKETKASPEVDPAKVKKAQFELSQREGELFWSVLFAPIRFCWEPLYRAIDWLIAVLTKQATKRRGSSVLAALGRSGKVLSQVQKTRSAWSDAYVARKALTTNDDLSSTDGVPPLPWSAWGAIVAWLVAIFFGLLLIAGLLWSFADRLIPPPEDAGAPPAAISEEPDSADQIAKEVEPTEQNEDDPTSP